MPALTIDWDVENPGFWMNQYNYRIVHAKEKGRPWAAFIAPFAVAPGAARFAGCAATTRSRTQPEDSTYLRGDFCHALAELLGRFQVARQHFLDAGVGRRLRHGARERGQVVHVVAVG